MQFELFQQEGDNADLMRDNLLHQGAYFRLAEGKYAFINKYDGVALFTKQADLLGRIHEIRQPIASQPVLPLEVLRLGVDLFYVRLLYQNEENQIIERIVSLTSLKEKNLSTFRRILQNDGVMMSSMESYRVSKVLLEILHVATANGKLPLRNVHRRDWIMEGGSLLSRPPGPALRLIHSANQ